MSKAPTRQELAEALGVGTSQVSKLAGRGMPVDSVDAAREWRRRNLSPQLAVEGLLFDWTG